MTYRREAVSKSQGAGLHPGALAKRALAKRALGAFPRAVQKGSAAHPVQLRVVAGAHPQRHRVLA